MRGRVVITLRYRTVVAVGGETYAVFGVVRIRSIENEWLRQKECKLPFQMATRPDRFRIVAYQSLIAKPAVIHCAVWRAGLAVGLVERQ